MSETFEFPLRRTVTFANGKTEVFDDPIEVTVEGGALKIHNRNETFDATWYSPSAWSSLAIRELKT